MTWRSETRACALAGCDQQFAPAREGQRYCCPRHRYRAQYQRREAARRGDRPTPSERRRERLALARRRYHVKGPLRDRDLADLLGVSRATAWRIRRAVGAVPAGGGRWQPKPQRRSGPRGVTRTR